MAISGLSYSRIQMGGLASGLDTEALVKQMASLSKIRINTQQQKLDLLSWKQTSYRDVIGKINSFKNTYYDALKPETNIMSNYLMNAYKATSTNDKVTVTSSSNALGGDYSISNIKQLAKNAEIKGDRNQVSQSIKLDFSKVKPDIVDRVDPDGVREVEQSVDYTVKVTLNGVAKDITFSSGTSEDADFGKNNEKFLSAVNTAFNLTGDKAFTIDADNYLAKGEPTGSTLTNNFSVSAGGKATSTDIKMLETATGITGGGTTNKISLNSKLSSVNFGTPLKGGSFQFNINGKDFVFDKDDTLKNVMDKVNGSNAGVKMSFDSLAQSFSIQSTAQGSASSIEISQKSGNLLSSLFGSSIPEGQQISSSSIMNTGIDSGKKVSSDYSSHVNKQISVTVNGVTKNIGMWQYDVNGMRIEYETKNDGENTIHGRDQTIKTLNAELQKAFGSNAPKFSVVAGADADGNPAQLISLNGANKSDVIAVGVAKEFDAMGKPYPDKPIGGSSDFLSSLGFLDTQTNGVNSTTTLENAIGITTDFKFNGKTFGKDSTIQNVVDTLNADPSFNMTFDEITGSFTINKGTLTSGELVPGDPTTDASNLINALFNVQNGEASAGTGSNTTTTLSGQNAIATVNGVEAEYNSNVISINGTNINIGGLSQDDIDKVNGPAGAGGTPIKITTTRDTSKSFDAVVKFVSDYNDLISELGKETSTRRPTSDGTISGTKYNPLTEEEREGMSDKEIEKWEEHAKTGLLNNDVAINTVVSKLKSAIATRMDNKFSLHDMGITVSNKVSDKGKLIIDEVKMKAAFEKYPDQIQELFTDPEKGLGANVKKAIDSGVNTSGTQLGSLVKIAGVEGMTTQSTNSLSKQIDTFKKSISELKVRYDKEVKRYWSQFTQLETAMSRYNSQSSWLTEQFGG